MRSHERCSVECRLAEIVVGGCAGGVEGLGILGADWCLRQGGVKARFLHLSEGVGFGLSGFGAGFGGVTRSGGCGSGFLGLSGFVLRQLQCGLGVGQLLGLGLGTLAVGLGAEHEMAQSRISTAAEMRMNSTWDNVPL